MYILEFCKVDYELRITHHRAAEKRESDGSPGEAVKLLPCDHEVMGLSLGNSLL
jgi:hypothetical protein